MNITGPVNITFPPLHGDYLTTAEAGRCNPCQASPSGFPLGGFRGPSSASRTKVAPACPHIRLTSLWLSWAILGVSQVLLERPVNLSRHCKDCLSKWQFAETMWRHSLLMPPGKKTKNTLACVFTVANVLTAGNVALVPLFAINI